MLAWYAASPNREGFLKTVQEFRYIIEPEATALAARAALRRADGRDQPGLRRHGQRPTALQERTDADTRFHLAILRASGNELLVPLGALIESALNQLFVFVTREVDDLRHAQTLHEKIEKAIRQRRPEAARVAVRKLLANTDEIITGQR